MSSAFDGIVQELSKAAEAKPKKGFAYRSDRNAEARKLLIGQSMDLPAGTCKSTPGNMGRACHMQFRQEKQPDGKLRIWRIR